jgi:hypothetical protein
MTEPVSPFFNHNPPPNPNPHMNPSPHGGQVHPDPKFLGEAMSRERRLAQRERERALANE